MVYYINYTDVLDIVFHRMMMDWHIERGQWYSELFDRIEPNETLVDERKYHHQQQDEHFDAEWKIWDEISERINNC